MSDDVAPVHRASLIAFVKEAIEVAEEEYGAQFNNREMDAIMQAARRRKRFARGTYFDEKRRVGSLTVQAGLTRRLKSSPDEDYPDYASSKAVDAFETAWDEITRGFTDAEETRREHVTILEVVT